MRESILVITGECDDVTKMVVVSKNGAMFGSRGLRTLNNWGKLIGTRGKIWSFAWLYVASLTTRGGYHEQVIFSGRHICQSQRKYYWTLRKFPVKFSLVIYFPCKIVSIYQECGEIACRRHNEVTRQRGQMNTIGVGLLGPRALVNFTPFVL